MKTQKEIETMANDFVSLAFSRQDLYDGFINSYFQCQQDMIKQDIIKSVFPKCACEPAIRLLGEYHCEMCGHRGW
jgi:hypothetical protein